MFLEALEAEPLPPVTFMVRFRSDSAVLSTESLSMLQQVIAAIRERNSTDIIISGHTDAVGADAYNQTLSLKRARAVADALAARGIDGQTFRITYHGKGNPLVPTADGVQEPRNRRVEITIR